MSGTQVSSEVNTAPRAGSQLRAIDTDVHPFLTSLDLLMPYLAPEWQRYVNWGVKHLFNAEPYITKPSSGRREWKPPQGGRAGADPELARKHLFEEQGIDIGILNCLQVSPDYGDVMHEFGLAVVAAYNNYQVDHWLSVDPRFRGSVYVSLYDPAAAAREIDRMAEHESIVQVILPLVANRQYGDPFYRPIFEAAVRHSMPVAIHHSGSTPTSLGFPRHWVEWHANFPQVMISQLTSIVFNGVFDVYSDLKLVLLESGFTWIPYWMSRLDRQYTEFRNTVPWVKRRPSQYLIDNVRVSTQPMEELSKSAFLRIIDQIGTDRVLMFSTDYPHADADQADEGLPSGLEEGLRHRIMALNALETFTRIRLD